MNEQEFSQALQKYADVVVRVGLNLRAGQRLFILAGIHDYPLVQACHRKRLSGRRLAMWMYSGWMRRSRISISIMPQKML